MKLEPTPVQRPHPPLKIAAVSPDTVTMYAERGLRSSPTRRTVQSHPGGGGHVAPRRRAAGHDTANAELMIMRLVMSPHARSGAG